MPTAPPRFGKRKPTAPPRAPSHYEKNRPNAAARGYGHRWRKARKAWLTHHPLCKSCESEGKVEPATVVDHVVPHRGDAELFWNQENWQSLCKPCHDRKTASGQ